MHKNCIKFDFNLQVNVMNRFPKFPKRIDPHINSILTMKSVRFIPVIILFNNFKDKSIGRKLQRAGFKMKWELPFINGICGYIPSRNFENLQKLIEIKKIYYDGKAKLMGWIDVDNDKNDASSYSVKSSMLSGKGVSIAFIDSGVYPHKHLVGSKNKIFAFRDFVNEINYPYDDSGHGTACIGAVCGFSSDGKFTAPAFDSRIVCAKAFDVADYGLYSDILGAMQWILDIKEKYNIRIAVMSFGTEHANNDFDILSYGAEAMWEKGIFVICSSGNLGPNAGTITSPGHNSKVLTVGAFKNQDGKPIVLPYSSRGPGKGNTMKPDIVMPGCFISSLNSDKSYYPAEKSKFGFEFKSQRTDYVKFSGTSAAVSQTAAAVAFLYEKKGDISPDDAKSIIKLCCASLGDSKMAQGEGFIDVKKIEEI